jgi:hypothetical protein
MAAPKFQWALQIGGATSTGFNVFNVDSAGNCYVTGQFVAKFDKSGNSIWVRHFTNLWLFPLVVPPAAQGDSAGNCYVTGGFVTNTDFGGTVLSPSGDYDIFTAKYDPAGNLLWVRQAGGSQYESGAAIAVDPSGNCYITGYSHSPSCQFGPITLTNPGSNNIFFAKYDANGDLLWAKRGGSASPNPAVSSVKFDAAGNAFFTGLLPGNGSDIDGFVLPDVAQSTSFGPSFLAKFDTSGSLLWAKRITNSFAKGLAVTSVGDFYLAGYFGNITSFDSLRATNSSGAGLFLVKYDANGNALRLTQAGVSDNCRGGCVALDSADNCYFSCRFATALPTLCGVTLGLPGLTSVIAKFDRSGALVWWRTAGATWVGNDLGIPQLGADANGNCYEAGIFDPPLAIFDTVRLTNNTSGSTFFLASLDRTPPPLTIQNISGTITLSWPTNYPDYSLQSADALNASKPWLPVYGTVGVTGSSYFLTDPATNLARFYRMGRP